MSDYNDGILPEPCLRMDTHFGDEYESIEFGDGTGCIKAAPILAKVGALHGEIDRLRDESADLRKEFDKMDKWHSSELIAEMEENAKLRELVRVMVYCMQYERECDGCRLNGADGTITAPVGCDGLFDRMRELGVDA